MRKPPCASASSPRHGLQTLRQLQQTEAVAAEVGKAVDLQLKHSKGVLHTPLHSARAHIIWYCFNSQLNNKRVSSVLLPHPARLAHCSYITYPAYFLCPPVQDQQRRAMQSATVTETAYPPLALQRQVIRRSERTEHAQSTADVMFEAANHLH